MAKQHTGIIEDFVQKSNSVPVAHKPKVRYNEVETEKNPVPAVELLQPEEWDLENHDGQSDEVTNG
jgi:hypothetical protein